MERTQSPGGFLWGLLKVPGLHQSGHSDGVRQETLSPSVLETGERAVFHLVFFPVYPKVCVKESGKGHFATFS